MIYDGPSNYFLLRTILFVSVANGLLNYTKHSIAKLIFVYMLYFAVNSKLNVIYYAERQLFIFCMNQ